MVKADCLYAVLVAVVLLLAQALLIVGLIISTLPTAPHPPATDCTPVQPTQTRAPTQAQVLTESPRSTIYTLRMDGVAPYVTHRVRL